MKGVRIVVILLVIAGSIGWYLWDRHEKTNPNGITVSGTIEADDVAVGPKVGGRVVAVLADDGDSVRAGQELIRLEGDRLEKERDQVRAQLAEAQAALLELENGARPEDIEEARAIVAQQRAVLERQETGSREEEIERARAEYEARLADAEVAQRTLDRFESMREEGVVSVQELDNASARARQARATAEAARHAFEELSTGSRREDIEQARSAVEAAGARLDRLTAGARSEEITRARARVAQIQAQLERNAVDLEETVIRAPADAIVEVLDLEPGDLVVPNQTAALLILPDSLWVRVYVPENRLGWVSLDQEVAVRVDTWPDEVFRGRVDQINRRAEFTPRNVQTVEERVRQVFGVRVRLENTGDKLRPGMAADVTFPNPGNGEAHEPD